MSKAKIARSHQDALVGFILAYQKRHPGAAHLNAVAQWILDQGLWEPPCRLRPLTILTRDLKRAAKESRIVDPQGRKVRAMLPAKIERVDSKGNKVFDVVWDHIFKMSAHHALLFLSQQYENIEKQCRSHKRVMESVHDNNPNCKQLQLELFDYDFRFATENLDQPSETIIESPSAAMS
jgi:hypothetical protein